MVGIIGGKKKVLVLWTAPLRTEHEIRTEQCSDTCQLKINLFLEMMWH